MADKGTLENVSVSSTSRCNYDVFLSFRGEDTRSDFVNHLYISLVQAHVHTYRDDEELPRGKEISAELQKAIQESRSSIVVLSKNYAASRWCLDELVEILNCKKAKGQLVLPIFYDVDPSDVRKQSGRIAEALAEQEKHLGHEVDKIVWWRKALTEVANLSGWDVRRAENGNELMIIQKIIEEVVCRLNHTYFDIAVYPVGIDSRVERLLSLLGLGSEDVRMIGICGMGGIGKTTTAKAVYNQVFYLFEGYCFLANVREVAQSFNGLVVLQKELLSKILKKKYNEFSNSAEGVNLINRRLQARRVFIILDDVDQLIQVNTLARSKEWFGSGSRIIITTRDEHLLDEINVGWKYKVNELAADESLELFNWHAFRNNSPTEEYMGLSCDIVRYTGGLPLALEILGSYLFERTVLVWESAIEKLQQIPDNQIQEKLRISFDGLDDKAKETFLDIACFFLGMEEGYVLKILDGRGFYPRITISVLTSRFLLNVDKDKKLRMHGLVRDMGRELVRQQSPNEPGKRNRLWFHEDVGSTLRKYKGTGAIEGISLFLPQLKDRQFSTKAFSEMDNLQLLQINHVHLRGSYSLVSKELSNCKEVWQGKKVLANLTILDLRHSHSLTKTPNFTGALVLEKLLVEGCTSLRKIHRSIGLLNRLVHLNLKDCNNLRHLPNSICRLKVLECLNLTGCTKLTRLPEDVGYMKGLKQLLADGSGIKQLPFSVGLLKNLIAMHMQGCNRRNRTKSLLSSLFSSCMPPIDSNITRFLPPSISGLFSIKELVLPNCSLSDGDIPTEIGTLSSLKRLVLTNNSFCSLPSNLSQLSNLDYLLLDECSSLSSIPQLPPNLSYLSARGCISLERLYLPKSSSKLETIALDGCNRLREIQGLESLSYANFVDLHGCGYLATIFKDWFYKGRLAFPNAQFIFPVSEVPQWFNHQIAGASISFSTPLNRSSKLLGIILWVVYRASEVVYGPTAITCDDKAEGIEEFFLSFSFDCAPMTTRDHSWVRYIPRDLLHLPILLEGGETVKVFIKANQGVEVKKIGIHLVCESDL